MVGGAGIPFHEAVEVVVGEGRRGAAGGAAGDVAPGVVAAGIALPAGVGAGRAQGVEAAQLVRCAAPIQGTLPQVA
ncbi:MAG TPA: hypothetical protein VFA09_21035 [Ktedonobacteraceae bacterium]|nr:hypothetical protein [Ktedonobacteraceae bacterium]